MTLKPDDLNTITATTLGHYNAVAEDFREGTRDHDVSQNIDALLRHIQGTAPFTVLDFGCGPGRDLQTFTRMGHIAVGLDGSERFAQMAREDSGCEVMQQDFLKLDLPAERFDGRKRMPEQAQNFKYIPWSDVAMRCTCHNPVI